MNIDAQNAGLREPTTMALETPRIARRLGELHPLDVLVCADTELEAYRAAAERLDIPMQWSQRGPHWVGRRAKST